MMPGGAAITRQQTLVTQINFIAKPEACLVSQIFLWCLQAFVLLPHISGTRHPSLYLSSSAANTACSVSPATLSTSSNRKAASICSADAFAEFAVTGSSRVLYSFFQV